jgi:hypothetical protein
MYGLDLDLTGAVLTPDFPIQNVDQLENVEASQRQIMPVGKASGDSEEIEKGYSEKMAKTEADRCLQCGLICYKRSETGIVSIRPFIDADISTSHSLLPTEPAEQVGVADISRIH